jgi:hypothetical protein
MQSWREPERPARVTQLVKEDFDGTARIGKFYDLRPSLDHPSANSAAQLFSDTRNTAPS